MVHKMHNIEKAPTAVAEFHELRLVAATHLETEIVVKKVVGAITKMI